MGCHTQDKATRRSPTRDQKGQQAKAFPSIRHMQPGPQGERRPPIAGHQQLEPTLPSKPRHQPQQPWLQPAQHHPSAARQTLHGQARVRQPHRVAE
jgi:hypothetical protein